MLLRLGRQKRASVQSTPRVCVGELMRVGTRLTTFADDGLPRVIARCNAAGDRVVQTAGPCLLGSRSPWYPEQIFVVPLDECCAYGSSCLPCQLGAAKGVQALPRVNRKTEHTCQVNAVCREAEKCARGPLESERRVRAGQGGVIWVVLGQVWPINGILLVPPAWLGELPVSAGSRHRDGPGCACARMWSGPTLQFAREEAVLLPAPH